MIYIEIVLAIITACGLGVFAYGFVKFIQGIE